MNIYEIKKTIEKVNEIKKIIKLTKQIKQQNDIHNKSRKVAN